MTTAANAVSTAALALHDAGLAVVRVKEDGTKRPIGEWKQYVAEGATREDRTTIEKWFSNGHRGVGVICGAISGNLELFELEGRAFSEGVADAFLESLRDHGLYELWERIYQGYSETSPSGGLHVLYRVTDGPAAGNTALARRPCTPEELAAKPGEKRKVLIETRGQGGFVVTAPSNGTTHETGKGWVMVHGGPATIADITSEQRDALYAVARMHDTMPLPPPVSYTPKPHNAVTDGELRPGDDFNIRAQWPDILKGWRIAFVTGGVTHWIRPGKKSSGPSATTGYGDRGDYLYVFSSNAELDADRAYDKFGAYTWLEHGGNIANATRELRRLGYGSERVRESVIGTFTPPTHSSTASTLSTISEFVQVDRPTQPVEPEEETPEPPAWLARMVGGGSFIFDAPESPPALWGEGTEVLWSEGEPCMITGPTGVGKTTLGGQLVAGRLGLIDEVLGFPVQPGERVLYLAMDRPSQIRRALRRLLGKYNREQLENKLVAWQGPPPRDLARNPRLLLEMAKHAGADTVVIDSLKDAAVKLSDEETGQGINSAMQHCVANGVEVLVYHHQVKRGAGGVNQPKSIEDVYGSAWITAGIGSAILLWGTPGDSVVELHHLKQPAEAVGPIKVIHDHEAGMSSVFEATDLYTLIQSAPHTARQAAIAMYGDGNGDVSPSDIEKARRKLEKLVKDGHAVKEGAASEGGAKGGKKGGGEGAKYVATVRLAPVDSFYPQPVDSDEISLHGAPRSLVKPQVDRPTHHKPGKSFTEGPRTSTPVTFSQVDRPTLTSTHSTRPTSTLSAPLINKGGSSGGPVAQLSGLIFDLIGSVLAEPNSGPRTVAEIAAAIPEDDVKKVERGLDALAFAGRVVRHASEGGNPVRWSNRTAAGAA